MGKIKKYFKKKAKEFKEASAEERAFKRELKQEQKQAEREARLSEAPMLAREKIALKKEAALKAYKEKLNQKKKPVKGFYGAENVFGFGATPQKQKVKKAPRFDPFFGGYR